MANVGINQTGSRWEGWVDNVMTGIEQKVDRFEKYAQSDDGKYRIAQVQLIASLATAVLLTLSSPLTVAVAAGVGLVVRAFSPEQLENIKNKISRISDQMPTSVKALAIVIAFIYVPILFPVGGGLYAGFEVGARISPHTLASGMDKIAAAVQKPGDGSDDEIDLSKV